LRVSHQRIALSDCNATACGGRRGRLLGIAALACTIILAAALVNAVPALADGGAGGTGASGCVDSITGTGGTGGAGSGGGPNAGGGGGGAGAVGGNGGVPTGDFPYPSGIGGQSAGAAGGDGATALDNNAGTGGGGGAHGFVGATLPTTAVTGGKGGTGSNGGGGGAGGYGAVVSGAGDLGNLVNAVTGGMGGNSGDTGVFSGNAGSGGIGLLLTSSVTNFAIRASVQGGNGGNAGSAPNGYSGNAGPGGIGLLLTSSGTVAIIGSVQGGNGGNGGSSQSPTPGGAGGTGAQSIGSGSHFSNGSTITGGNGGAGGNAISACCGPNGPGGSGGAGGIGVQFGSGSNFTNSGTVNGGNGGSGGSGTAKGPNGNGGVGVMGAGLTIINNGTIMGGLSGDGVTRADAIIFTGGTNLLSGTGTVGSFTMITGSTFAPGSGTPGTSMKVAGNLAFQSGAIYLVQVNSTVASSANVTGTASLGGAAVQATFVLDKGQQPAKSYTILSAAGLNGTFSPTVQTTNLPAGFTASLSNVGTNVMLNVTAKLGGPQQVTGLSSNHQSAATAINNFFNDPPLPPAFLPLFSLTGGNLTNALTQLSGEVATGAQQPAFQLTNQFLNIMLDPFVDGRGNPIGGSAIGFAPEREELPDDVALAYAKILKAPPKPQTFDQPWSVWGAGYGGSNRTTGESIVAGSHDLAASTAGGTAGLDYRLAPGTVVGFALAGGGTNWNLAQALGGGKSDAFQAGVYGTARWGSAYLAAALAFTNHWMSTDRFAFAGDHLSANFNAQSYGGRVESGYRFATYYGGLTPYAAIQSQTFHTPGYLETDLNGGGFALGFNSRNGTDTRSELGGRFDRLLLLNPEAALTLRARVAWAHDWVSDPTLTAAFQMLPGSDTSFIVNGATPAKNSALVSEGVELRLANGVVLLGKFDGEFASHSTTYAGTGTVRYTW
jgi:outer membrane autotransporter protein